MDFNSKASGSFVLLKSLALIGIATPLLNSAPLLSEGFDNLSTLATSGWVLTNNSSPAGTSGWFQGLPAIFPSQSGPTNSYVAANFLNAAFGGTISNWLLTPILTLENGETLTFYTQTESPALGADRLEVRLSQNGGSTNVGTGASSVGDFTSLLTTVNPALSASGYPASWTQFALTLSGLAAPVSGRFAFRYSVPDTSTNGDYIGLDTVVLDTVGLNPVPEPSVFGLGLLGLACLKFRRGNRTW
jgi:hypothetical protein